MPDFSEHSLGELDGTHHNLVRICHRIIPHMDFRVLEGPRSIERQRRLIAQGYSKLNSALSNTGLARKAKHVVLPGIRDTAAAVDLAPWPIDWEDTERFVLLAGRFLQAADELGIEVTWGGDWDMDARLLEERFRDYGHFELREAR